MKGNADDKVAKESAVPPPPLPPPLPPPASEPAVSLSGRPDRHAWSSKALASFEARRRSLKPVGSDEVAQWLRHVRNLRRAIVVATILGPPSQ